jgi:hypothetical protein
MNASTRGHSAARAAASAAGEPPYEGTTAAGVYGTADPSR